jgi:hypothetical protein
MKYLLKSLLKKVLVLFSTAILIGGCAKHVGIMTSAPLKIGQKNFYGVVVKCGGWLGTNVKTLNTVAVDETGKTETIHSFSAATPGIAQSITTIGGAIGAVRAAGNGQISVPGGTTP